MIKLLFKFISLFFGWFIRNSNLVAIYSVHNNFTGNCKYAVKAIQEKFPEKTIVWFVDNQQQAESLRAVSNVKVVTKASLDHFKYALTAKYILSDRSFILWAVGAVQIDFWHGMEIKKIKYDQIGGTPNLKQRIIYWLNRKNWIVSGNSLFEVHCLCDSGRLSYKMGRVLGTPCIAPLVDKNILNEEIKQNKTFTKLQGKINQYDKVFLYAPTFRDSGADFLQGLNFDIQKLQNVCKQRNILFLIKMHPWCNLHLDKQYDNIIILDKSCEAVILIGMSDCVISDYSSMVYYAMAGGKELIYMHGDIAEYCNNNRDIYDWALNDIQGHKIDDFNDLSKIIKNDIPIKPVPDEIFNKYFDKEILANPYKFLEVFK